jgi:hypothetical protein
MQQLGTCRALLIDNGDDEFELDPFPAAVPSSPSTQRHRAAGGWTTYAGLDQLQVRAWLHICRFIRLEGEWSHVDMFGHNKSAIAHHDKSRRVKAVVNHKRELHRQPRLP